jgi:Fur family ferric uptake transcriptional regulator
MGGIARGKDNEERRARLRRYLDERGLRSTRQRDLIIEAFFKSHRHVNAEELYRIVRKRDPHIGVATVYRTLRLLIESGVATQRNFGSGQACYEVVDHHHDHLICTRCGAILEFENETIEELQIEVARKHRFTITHHKLELYGLCESCKGEPESSHRDS